MNGIEKEIDSLGRVVIPIKYRKRLGLMKGARVFVSLDESVISISPQNQICALCGKTIDKKMKYRLCVSCITKIKSE